LIATVARSWRLRPSKKRVVVGQQRICSVRKEEGYREDSPKQFGAQKKKNDLSKCTILRPKTRLVIASTTRNQKTWEYTVPLSFLHLSVSLPFLLLHLRITRGKTECSNRIASSCCLPPLSVALCFSRNNAPTKFTSFSGRGALFCGCGTRKSLIPFAENCVLAEVTLFLCEVAFLYRLNKFFPFSPSVRSSLLYCSIGKHCGAM